MTTPSELAGRYAVAVDTRDTAALAAVFAADAEFVQPPALTRGAGEVVTRGRDRIVETLLGATAHLHGTHHAVHQVVLHPEGLDDGDTATGTVYCLAHHLYAARDGGMRDNSVAIRYRDTYRRVDGRWVIARRELTVDFTEDRPVAVP